MPLEFEAGEENGVMRRFVQTGTADTPSFEDVAALLIGTDHPRPFLAIPAVTVAVAAAVSIPSSAPDPQSPAGKKPLLSVAAVFWVPSRRLL